MKTEKHLCFSCGNTSCRERVYIPREKGIVEECDNAILRKPIAKDQKKLDDNEQTNLFQTVNIDTINREDKWFL